MRLRTSSSVRTKMTRQLYAQDALRLRNVTMALRQYALTASPVNACLPEAPRHPWLVRRPRGIPKASEATAYAVETLYRERKLSVMQIAKKLKISKSTLYKYLRYRNVEIGPYQHTEIEKCKRVATLAKHFGHRDPEMCSTYATRIEPRTSCD